jgi:hypothetical protein
VAAHVWQCSSSVAADYADCLASYLSTPPCIILAAERARSPDLVSVVLSIEPFKLKLTFLVFAYSYMKTNAAHAALLACRGTVVVMPRLLRVCLNADGNHEFAQAWTLETVLGKLTELETRLGCLVYPPTQELRALYSKPILQAHIEGAIKQMDNKDLVYAIPTKMFKLPDNEMDSDTAVNNLCRVVSTSLLHCKWYASLLCVCCQIYIPLSRTHGQTFRVITSLKAALFPYYGHYRD